MQTFFYLSHAVYAMGMRLASHLIIYKYNSTRTIIYTFIFCKLFNFKHNLIRQDTAIIPIVIIFLYNKY